MTLNIITYKDNHDQFMGLHFKYWKVIMLIYRLKIWVIFCRPQCVNIMWHSGAIWQHGRNYCVKRNIVLRYYLLCQWYVRLCLLVGSRCGYPFGVGVGGEVGVGVRWGWWGWGWGRYVSRYKFKASCFYNVADAVALLTHCCFTTP